MKPTHFIVVRRTGKVVAEYPVTRAVVRVGADPNSDVVLEGDSLPPSALTINFADPNKIICYARAAVIDSIAGQAPVINQGVLLPLKGEVAFANGYSLSAELRESSSVAPADIQGKNAGAKVDCSPESSPESASRKQRGPVADRISESRRPEKSNLKLPVIAGVAILSLLALAGFLFQRSDSSSVIPKKSLDGRTALSYQTITNQLFGLPDEELSSRPDLFAVREQLKLAQKFRNNTEKSREHMQLARDLLRRSLGNEIVTAEPPPPFLQSRFDRVSEIQLHQEICKLLF